MGIKRLFLAFLFVFVPYTAFSAGLDVVNQEVTTVCEPSSTNCVRVLRFDIKADSGDASIRSTSVTTANMSKLYGWILMTGSALNGLGGGPTASSVVKLTTVTEGDILGGSGKTPSAATAGLDIKFRPFTDSTLLAPGPYIVSSGLTLTITGNAVNSAALTLVFKFLPSRP